MRKKSFLVYGVISTFFCLTFSSLLLAQWSPYGNAGWFSQPFVSLPFFSFNPMYNYSYDNIQYPFYNSYYSPFSTYNNSLILALPSSSGPWYTPPVNYTDSYNQSWFDNSVYRSRSYTTVYNNFQPPPLGTPGYTNWLSSDYSAQYPFRYGSGPPIPRNEPEDKGKWESQVLKDAYGNRLKGDLEYYTAYSHYPVNIYGVEMSGHPLLQGEGTVGKFEGKRPDSNDPISFEVHFDSDYTAVFTGFNNSVTDYLEGEYVVKDNSGQIADRGTFYLYDVSYAIS